MASEELLALQLCTAAHAEADIAQFRARALQVLGTAIAFDAALFHELSPRKSLQRAALVGLDPAELANNQRSWDESAVALGRLRDLALQQAGVVSDREAFPVGSPGRRQWQRRVAGPFGVSALLMAHLVVRERLASAVVLFRRSGMSFSEADAQRLRQLVPVLAVCDGLQQDLAQPSALGPVTTLKCEDQRLNGRQRELVVRVALGHTNQQIAAALQLSPHTVRNQLVLVRQLLGAANRAEIVRLAVLR